ncbi:hypothetical protein ACWEKT_15770 [Nocardia takedensis]
MRTALLERSGDRRSFPGAIGRNRRYPAASVKIRARLQNYVTVTIGAGKETE